MLPNVFPTSCSTATSKKQACLSCRHLKKQCDGKRPCSSCKARGRECAYHDAIPRGPHRAGSVRRISGPPQPAIFNGVFGHIYQLDAPAPSAVYDMWGPPLVYQPEASHLQLPLHHLLLTGTGLDGQAGQNRLGSNLTQMVMFNSGVGASAEGNGQGANQVTSKATTLATAGGRKIRHNIADACAACRKSKVKCDEVKPCTRCMKNAQPCLDWRNEAPHSGERRRTIRCAMPDT
jgi:hypothetical protein